MSTAGPGRPKAVLRRWVGPMLAREPMHRPDSIAFSMGFRGRRRHEGVHLVVTPAPRGRNIGDHAMLESFAAGVDAPVVVVERETTRASWPVSSQHEVRFATLPALLYGRGPAHLRAVWRYARLVRDVESVSVVGADVMDGEYVVRASVMRARVAELPARSGVPTRILGFSWNQHPDPRATRAVARAADAGVRLLVREPASAARLRAVVPHGVEDVADLAFADEVCDPSAADRILGPGPTTAPAGIALVNASGYVGGMVDQLSSYTDLVRHLQGRGYRVVLVPHSDRDPANDVRMVRAVADALGDPEVVTIGEMLSPRQIRGLCARAALVVTGRMHLSVIGLSQGVPVVAISTQGKVLGMLGLFGMERFCIEPGPALGAQLVEAVDAVDRDREAIVRQIAESLPRVRRLARANFAGLGPADEGREASLARA